MAWLASAGRFPSDEQGQFPPLPEAVGVVVADFAEPAELGFDVEELVGRVFVGGCDAEGVEEAGVEAGGGGGDVLEVAKEAAGVEGRPDFLVEVALAGVVGFWKNSGEVGQ